MTDPSWQLSHKIKNTEVDFYNPEETPDKARVCSLSGLKNHINDDGG